ncbi:hypothetical protein ISF_05912 [Cordyceps fumosorosea ARSEF 2679]|uniref:ATP-binding protein n=1 Tax=Cordyceps fumosorosea (strain ARSEF 2679) TaxID=1081104 RepID=A0A167TRL1_CORFA|nr:hypothetical protein ISF_05912 [Cordyceps fumosorosea ARSEF 2679]OAA60873.1 hypothetical protein ISF_05912 [Cordyceps fumosorosea ARSEF 2679]
MSGAPGSGKSTLARLLRPLVGGAVVDHDILRSAFLTAGLDFQAAARSAYRLQWALAEDLVARQGLSVIVDSTCNYPETLAEGGALAERHGCDYWYVECRVRDVDLLDGRLRARPAPMPSQRGGVDDYPAGAVEGGVADEDPKERFVTQMGNPCRPATEENVIIVDGTERPEKLREDILKRILG